MSGVTFDLVLNSYLSYQLSYLANTHIIAHTTIQLRVGPWP